MGGTQRNIRRVLISRLLVHDQITLVTLFCAPHYQFFTTFSLIFNPCAFSKFNNYQLWSNFPFLVDNWLFEFIISQLDQYFSYFNSLLTNIRTMDIIIISCWVYKIFNQNNKFNRKYINWSTTRASHNSLGFRLAFSCTYIFSLNM